MILFTIYVKITVSGRQDRMILYFDTETMGLYPGRIIQLAYILDDGENAVGKNFYFAVDYIEPSATAVHGITVEKLRVLSGGKIVFTTNHFSTYAVLFEDAAVAPEKNGLSGGAIAGIVIGCFFGLLIIACAVLFILHKKGIVHIAFIDKVLKK